jgi:hypothetical protein
VIRVNHFVADFVIHSFGSPPGGTGKSVGNCVGRVKIYPVE